jgi:hypothetical protein
LVPGVTAPLSSCAPVLRPNFMLKCYLIARDLQTMQGGESSSIIRATIHPWLNWDCDMCS